MNCLSKILFAVLLPLAVGGASPLFAENEGQDDLNQATEKKMAATTMDDLNEVIRLAESALQKGLDDSNKEFANKMLASTLTQRGASFAAAIFSTNPPDPGWPQYRQRALADLEKGLKLDPKQPQALMLVVQMNVLPQGDLKRAKEAAGQAVEAAGDDAMLKAKALVLRATLEKNLEKRLPDMNEAVRLARDDAGIVRARGMLLADLGKNEEALADIVKSIELAPDNVGAYELKSLILARMKKFDEAVAAIEKVREKLPDSPLPLLQRAQIHNQQGKRDEAIDDLAKAYEKDIGNVAILLMRSSIHFDKGDKPKALADADECLRLRPNNPEATRYRALLLAEMDRLDEAVAALQNLIDRDPKENVQSVFTLAQLYVTKKKSAKALEVYDKYAANYPENGELLRGRGDAYLNLGKQAEAVADYEKAYKVMPKDSGLLNNFAWVLATSTDDKLRNGKRAVELATQACELTGYKLPHILSTLAAAYAETGDFENARKWAGKAVEIGLKDQDEELKKELESYKQNKPWRELLSEEPPKDK
ncbi:MAG: tetratricopeptide repeat protein [Pirellulales bacterium]|nr:tetratricopeptide repeat protein [Pirellulales bacterium]